MAPTIEELEKRLAAVEQELADLRQRLDQQAIAKTRAERGAELLRLARANQSIISAGVAKAFAEMGITAKPIGAEKVQEMTRACGIKPEDNEISRGIIAMREE
jgi:hypothetical protein